MRVAVIGMGKMGLSHASILSTIAEAELVACVDPSPAAERLARSVGIPAPFFRSVADAWERRPDAAFVCVPSHLNMPIVQQCVQRDAHVFLEKPLATDLGTAREMLELERARPELRFGIGYMGAHVATFEKAREHLRAGGIGRVVAAVIRAEHGLVFAPQDQWPFKRSAAGGGAAVTIGSHAILQLHRLLGRAASIESASCLFVSGNEVEDRVHARGRLESGGAVEMVFDWSCEACPQLTVSLEISGTEGTIRVSESWLEVATERGTVSTHVSELPDPAGFYLGGDGYCLEDERFVALCLRGGSPVVTWSDAYHVQEVIEAIYRSAQRGTRIELA